MPHNLNSKKEGASFDTPSYKQESEWFYLTDAAHSSMYFSNTVNGMSP